MGLAWVSLRRMTHPSSNHAFRADQVAGLYRHVAEHEKADADVALGPGGGGVGQGQLASDDQPLLEGGLCADQVAGLDRHLAKVSGSSGFQVGLRIEI